MGIIFISTVNLSRFLFTDMSQEHRDEPESLLKPLAGGGNTME